MLRSIAGKHPRANAVRWISSSVAMERDVVIVGGGPAGLALANALGEFLRSVTERTGTSLNYDKPHLA